MKSDVYFIEADSTVKNSRQDALLKLLAKTRPFKEYKKDEFIPIKLTLGDSQCVYNINPTLVKIIVSKIKEYKSRPFIFDTNVIYKGMRQNAVDHLTVSQNKGFGYSRVGAPFIVADGVFGQDGKEYEINSGYIKKIKIPYFIGMVDSLLVLSHATGHILAGYAGAIKNVAMGMSSKSTKQVLHSSLKPSVIDNNCTACGNCIKICPVSAITFKTEKASINQAECIGCAECLCACKFNAIFINWDEDHDIFAKRLVDTAKFILSRFKNKFFITFAFDITKECDCISVKNEEIFSRDLGILASDDCLALDMATVDLINKKEDLFMACRLLNTHKTVFSYAAETGLGNSAYNLIRL